MTHSLPAQLDHLTLLDALGGRGAEADLLLAQDADGTRLVVKHYRPGRAADRTVWRRLEQLDHPAVLRILDHGTDDEGRDFEVVPYYPNGSLRRYWDLRVLSAGELRPIVRQLAGALNCLHAAGILHRDLKPDNLLVGTDLTELVIADFGISRAKEEALLGATRAGTEFYAPPEWLSGTATEAWDWWSLGVIVRQLALGVRPQDELVAGAPASVEPDVSKLPAALRSLCAGLLTADVRHRWGSAEVLDWLDGAEPPVFRSSATVQPTVTDPEIHPDRAPLAFAGGLHSTRKSLAEALRANWALAADRFFGAMGTPAAPSEAWAGLLSWLRQFDDPRQDDVEGRIVLVDRHLTAADADPDTKLLHLLLWLDPDGTPVHLGHTVDEQLLVRLSLAMAGDGTPQDRTLFAVLASPGMLRTLSGWTRLASFEDLAARWEAADRSLAAGLTGDAAAWAVPAPAASALRHLTLLAVLGPEARQRLAVLADRTAPAVGDCPPYDALVAALWRSDPALGQVTRIGCADAARAWVRQAEEARREARRRAEEEAARAERERRAQEEHDAAQERERAAREQRRRQQAAHLRDLRALEEDWSERERSRTAPAARAGALLRHALHLLPPVALGWALAVPVGWAGRIGAGYLFAIVVLLDAVVVWLCAVPALLRFGGAYAPPLVPRPGVRSGRTRNQLGARLGLLCAFTVLGLALIGMSRPNLDPMLSGPSAPLVMLSFLTLVPLSVWVGARPSPWDAEHRRRHAAYAEQHRRLRELIDGVGHAG